jgi:uncharacterized membrane protein
MHGRAAQAALGALAIAWLIAVVFAPGLVFPIGQFVCHQRPDRSFFVNGHQLAVCARCTGIYTGAAAALPLALAIGASLSAFRARALLAIAGAPTLITWSLEFAGFFPFSNTVRYLAGLPLGLAAAWLVLTNLSHRPSDIGPRLSDSVR